MKTTMVSTGAANTANALWTLIEPQDRHVREYLEILIRKSLTKKHDASGNDGRTRAERFAQIFKDVKLQRDKSLSPYPLMDDFGVDLGLPPDFDEKEEYRKHLEEKYR